MQHTDTLIVRLDLGGWHKGEGLSNRELRAAKARQENEGDDPACGQSGGQRRLLYSARFSGPR